MSAVGDALYKSDMFLLTLKGWVTVHFMDEQALEGEYLTQDTLNIFLNIDGTPIMIPRSQIRYIQGEPGQPVEEDTSLLQPHAIKTEETEAPDSASKTAEMPLPLEQYPETPQPVTAGFDDEYDDDDDDDNEYDDDDGGTFVLGVEDMDDIYAASTQEANLAEADVDNAEEDTGLTFVLDESAGMAALYGDEAVESDLELDDEATVLLDEENEMGAQLICTDGPHAGESFKLTGAVFTMGRATDNDFPLPGDKEISRRHAIITRDMGRFRIQDQNSLNGTFVNEERLDNPRYLENGDIILIGISHIEYQEY